MKAEKQGYFSKVGREYCFTILVYLHTAELSERHFNTYVLTMDLCS